MSTAPADEPLIQVNGGPATPGQLAAAALTGYGHFTAMQVRGQAVRGLSLHLARLASAHREMFGADLDTALIRDYILRALAVVRDASVRVYLLDTPDEPQAVVTVRGPARLLDTPYRMRSVPYQRPVPHIKHVGDFGQSYFHNLARRTGFDEALLTTPGGEVTEGSRTNVGFADGAGVVWPSAPALAGITMQVLERQLAARGIESRREPIRIDEIGRFTAAFVTNARGIAPVGRIDDREIPADLALISELTSAYDAAAWESLRPAGTDPGGASRSDPDGQPI